MIKAKNGPCEVCGTVYNKSRFGVEDDSHFTYTEYALCPTCGYHPGLQDLILAAIERSAIISCRPGKPLELNSLEVVRIATEMIREDWVRQKDKKTAKAS